MGKFLAWSWEAGWGPNKTEGWFLRQNRRGIIEAEVFGGTCYTIETMAERHPHSVSLLKRLWWSSNQSAGVDGRHQFQELLSFKLVQFENIVWIHMHSIRQLWLHPGQYIQQWYIASAKEEGVYLSMYIASESTLREVPIDRHCRREYDVESVYRYTLEIYWGMYRKLLPAIQ